MRRPLHRSRIGDLDVHAGTVGPVEVVAALTGIGTRVAAEATERLLCSIPVDHLLVVGIAGGIAPHVAVGDLVVPELVIDAATGKEYRPSPFGDAAMRGKLSTSDEFLVDRERLAELAARGVVAVDMETASIAAVCERRGCPWSAFRAISDMAGDTPHAVLGLARPDGTPNLPATARFLLTAYGGLANPSTQGNLSLRALSDLDHSLEVPIRAARDRSGFELRRSRSARGAGTPSKVH